MRFGRGRGLARRRAEQRTRNGASSVPGARRAPSRAREEAASPEPGPLGSLRLWLTPGMGVKRFVLVAVLGGIVTLIAAGLGVLWLLAEERRAIAAPIEDVLVSPLWRNVGGWLALMLGFVGVTLAVRAIGQLNRSLLSNWMPRPRDAARVLHDRLSLSRGPHIVAFGGGTGLSNLLRGLRRHTSNVTAVVTVSDDGGSSGRLRRAFGMPAPGDLSDCLAALSDQEVQVSRLLDYRFQRGDELQGHTFGNLLITTLSEVEGDFGEASRVLNALLNLSGSVWPVTAQPVTLRVVKRGGERIEGESRVREVPGPIDHLELSPSDPRPLPEVVEAIDAAELVVLGPGSLFTSTLPGLLVPEVRAALERSPARLVYVCNIMTEAGETDGFTAFDHVAVLREQLGRWPDLVLANDAPLDEQRQRAYRREDAEVVVSDVDRFEEKRVPLRTLPLLGGGPHAQHDSERLADELVLLARPPRRPWAALAGSIR